MDNYICENQKQKTKQNKKNTAKKKKNTIDKCCCIV